MPARSAPIRRHVSGFRISTSSQVVFAGNYLVLTSIENSIETKWRLSMVGRRAVQRYKSECAVGLGAWNAPEIVGFSRSCQFSNQELANSA